MSQEYTPVEWVDETPTTEGTTINKERLDQMQTAHHYADGFEEVDLVPTGNPGVDYHKIVYCTADNAIYRWDGTQWTKDVDDSTKALLEAHIANRSNPHQVTKAQVGLGSVDNTSDADKPISTAMAAALAGKIDDAQLVTSWQAVPDNVHIPAEKLVKDDLATLGVGIDGINAKIPAGASASNQLADKDFVNSSISTNTANFLGTYDAMSGLGFTQAEVDAFTDPPDAATQAQVGARIGTAVASAGKTATNNDYVFISVNKAATVDNDWFWRFKYNGAGWAYEFTLNNSSFTADQWAAINSGITAGKVAGYDAHVASTANPHGVTKAQVGLGSVANYPQDNAPTQGSDNYVKSSGVYAGLAGKLDKTTSSGQYARAYAVGADGTQQLLLPATDAATGSALALRDAAGNVKVADPLANTDAATKQYVDTADATKQDALVSGTNIKTINGSSILGSGDLTVSATPETELPIYIDENGKVALKGWQLVTFTDWSTFLDGNTIKEDLIFVLFTGAPITEIYMPKGADSRYISACTMRGSDSYQLQWFHPAITAYKILSGTYSTTFYYMEIQGGNFSPEDNGITITLNRSNTTFPKIIDPTSTNYGMRLYRRA